MKQNLSEEQAEIVFYNEAQGAIVATAAAGSGKTRVLTERVRYILNKKDKFLAVLCLTFTNKAAEEMRARLEDLSERQKERAFIGNFHEFCLQEILRLRYMKIGLSDLPHIFDTNDCMQLLIQIFQDNENFKPFYEGKSQKEQQDMLKKFSDFISEAKQNLVINPDEADPIRWTEKRILLYNEYNNLLIAQNAMDYNDILLYAYRILIENKPVANIYRRLYQYILIDEAQDLNFAQYSILRAICGDTHRNVLMVGDINQAIFGFSGADIKYMTTEFVRDFDAVEKTIQHNYRSSNQVLQLAQHIKPNGGLPQNYFEGKVEIKAFNNETDEANWIVADIKNWLIHKKEYTEPDKISIPIQASDIAILARNRYIWRKVEAALEQDDYLKDKFCIKRIGERFAPESKIIHIFDLGLSMLVNPQDILHFKALCYELGLDKNYKPSNVDDFLLNDIKNIVNLSTMPFIDAIVNAWTKLYHNQKILHNVCTTLLQNLQEILSIDDNKDLILIENDINELTNLWLMFIQKTAYEAQNIANFRYFLAFSKITAKKEGIVLSTVHSLKGLEYEIVYIIGMNEGIFPDNRAIKANNITEESNSAYVAITRAKRVAFLTHTEVRNGRFSKISSFIENFNANIF